MRTLVIGDVHGAYKAMKHTLEIANFDYDNDTLICLGDVVDGWSQSKEVIDELLKIKNLVYLLGNHDEWALEYYSGKMPIVNGIIIPSDTWFIQGGKETIQSLGTYEEQDPKYLDFLKRGKMYHEIENDGERIIFAHGNIPNKLYNMQKLVEKGQTWEFIWDRFLITEAANKRNTWKTVDDRFKEIYLGHSGVTFLMKEDEHGYKPQKMTNVWAMDTSAAYNGKISIMDIKTKELFQSDFVYKYYPDERGRNYETYNDMLKKSRITPPDIEKLYNNEIFVFGSNLSGIHGKGAAKYAKDYFGAIQGNGIGLQGNSYALPTKDKNVYDRLSIENIKNYIDEFIEFSKDRMDLVFLVTEIGCGYAGYKSKDIAPLFKDSLHIKNICLPKSFWDIIS